MSIQLLDTTTGGGDSPQVGGNKINANFVFLSSPGAYLGTGGRTDTGRSQHPSYEVWQAQSDATGSDYAHGFADSSVWSRSGNKAYGAFDGRVLITGANNMDHYVSFQGLPTVDAAYTGTILNLIGSAVYSYLNGGTVTNSYGYSVADAIKTGSATLGTQYGFHCHALIAGATNWGIYIESNKSYFGGDVQIAGSANGLILTSANGSQARVTLKDDGTLQVAPVSGFTTPTAKYNFSSLVDSVGGYNLTDHGGITFTAGKVGNAASFNGSTQYATNASLNLSSSNFTLAMWVNFTAGAASYIAAQFSSSAGIRWQMYVDTANKVNLQVVDASGSSGPTALSAAISAGAWHFVVAQWNESTHVARLKIDDGAWSASTAGSSGMYTTGTAAAFSFAANADGGGPLTGALDATRVFKSIISDSELTALYNGGAGTES